MSIEGVDYSFSPPSVASLVAAKKKFVVRYGGPGTSGKWLKASEYAALKAAGIEVVANAEGSASGFNSFEVGRSWATSAYNYFRGLGMPVNRPIYFSADWDVQASQWDGVKAALRGAASVIGPNMVGLYAGRRPIEWAKRDGVAPWRWQTYAWSGGLWAPGNHLEQYRNGVSMGGGQVDLCRALTADYGQWGYTTQNGDDDMTPEQAAQLNTLYALLVDGVRTQGSFTYTPPGGESQPINPLYNAVWQAVQAARKSGDSLVISEAQLTTLSNAIAAKVQGLTAAQVQAIVREELNKTKLAG